MKVYTFSQARQQLASVLDQAKHDGQARITRRDGQVFIVTPERSPRSPLDVKGAKVRLSTQVILESIRESRKPRSSKE